MTCIVTLAGKSWSACVQWPGVLVSGTDWRSRGHGINEIHWWVTDVNYKNTPAVTRCCNHAIYDVNIWCLRAARWTAVLTSIMQSSFLTWPNSPHHVFYSTIYVCQGVHFHILHYISECSQICLKNHHKIVKNCSDQNRQSLDTYHKFDLLVGYARTTTWPHGINNLQNLG